MKEILNRTELATTLCSEKNAKAKRAAKEIKLISDRTEAVAFCFFTKFLMNNISVKTANKTHIAYRNKRPSILYSEKTLFMILSKIGCKALSSKPASK